mgnify:FL=1
MGLVYTYNYGTTANCYLLGKTVSETDETIATEAQFTNGAVAYKLAAACNDPGKPDKAGDTYQIASYENLLWFAKLANGTLMQGMPAKPAANAVLMKAIDITVDTVDTVGTVGKSWPGISTSDNPYNGRFNGNGYTVTLKGADVSTAATKRRR